MTVPIKATKLSLKYFEPNLRSSSGSHSNLLQSKKWKWAYHQLRYRVYSLVEDTSNLNHELFLNLKQFRSLKWYMKYYALFFTTFMYINMHDGIDFDGFNNLTFEKKIFF